MKTMYRFFFVALILFVPLISILSASNLVLRLPDMYVYQFNSMDLTNEMNLEMTSEELGNFFSNYMLGKEDEFAIDTSYVGKEGPQFTAEENAIMRHFRGVLNHSLLVLFILTLLGLVMYIMLFRDDRKEALRVALKCAFFFYLLLLIIGLVGYFIPATRASLYSFIFQYPLQKEGLLTLIFTDSMAKTCLGAMVVVSAVVLGALASLTWRITRPKRMFYQQ